MGLNYLCSENKDTVQLHGYHAADLRLCFLMTWLIIFYTTLKMCTCIGQLKIMYT